ncbi:hypothetical protein EJ04DRAFT_431687 [Polyplosphaeria fusca]|uniref:Uncharacterized protein n=1 Tax=Polyplosphaeria fusca TaxID=682080 RepID=A0A9P4V3S7_9PLEO|nr:hypothetical protein EJ04DRAFT_431687 [Polyplosphaeria fusca]
MGPRGRSALRGLLALGCMVGLVCAEVKDFISTAADFNTECKTCPHSVCTNQLYYSYDETFNVTCWTRGTRIMEDNIWLKSQAGCYVTQWDLYEYTGSWTSDLAYCGKASEDESITTEDATLQYKTECRICPDIDCDIMAYLPEDTDLSLTCWTDKGQIIIDDPYHFKTTNNCYVAEKGLYEKPDLTNLDNCGPIPFLEELWHWNENGTSDIDKRSPLPVPAEQGVQYLINVTVGEDYAPCRKCPQDNCKTEKKYVFDQEVWLQCLVENNGTWWSETTDFCYVKNSDFWQCPECDYYKNPLCEWFANPDDTEN